MEQTIISNSALWYLVPSVIMFACGLYGFLTRRNMIAMLISLELMLNSADLNFVIFNRYLFPGSMEGMMFALFAIAIAAAETAIAIAIIINIYRAAGHTEIREINKMRF
jgi:NADH-quinone oxidoreductase subunit K